MRIVDVVVRTVMAERFARPESGEHLERLVEHLGMHLRVDGLAERAELLVGREAETDAEDGLPAGHVIERGDLLGHYLRSSSRERCDDRAQMQALRACGARAEHHPGVVDVEVEITTKVEVVPQEEAVPTRRLGKLGELDQRRRVTDIGDADRAKRTGRLYTICLFDAADSLKPMYLDVTDDTFQTDVVERSAEVPVVIDLWAPWCGPCRTLGPIIEKVVDETDGQVVLVKVNVDENPDISRAFQVQCIPLVIAVKDGQAVDGFLGAQPEPAVRDFVLGLLPTEEESAIDALVAVGDEASLRQALELDPGHEAAVIGLAELLVEKGESEEALGLRQRIPENAETRRVAALARLGDEAPLDDDFDEKLNSLLERVKDDDAARQEYVDLLELMGADDPRTAVYRKALTARLVLTGQCRSNAVRGIASGSEGPCRAAPRGSRSARRSACGHVPRTALASFVTRSSTSCSGATSATSASSVGTWPHISGAGCVDIRTRPRTGASRSRSRPSGWRAGWR